MYIFSFLNINCSSSLGEVCLVFYVCAYCSMIMYIFILSISMNCSSRLYNVNNYIYFYFYFVPSGCWGSVKGLVCNLRAAVWGFPRRFAGSPRPSPCDGRLRSGWVRAERRLRRAGGSAPSRKATGSGERRTKTVPKTLLTDSNVCHSASQLKHLLQSFLAARTPVPPERVIFFYY